MMLHPLARRGNHAGASPGARWALWGLPGGARVYLLSVELTAAAVTIGLMVSERSSSTVIWRFLVLLGVTIGYAEVSKRSERIRRYLGAGTSTPRPNPLSVWSFAALLLLPAGWAAGYVVAQHGHLWWQRRRDKSGASYRVVFTGAAAVVGQLAAAGVLDEHTAGGILRAQLVPSLSIIGAALIYTLIDFGVLLAGMWLAARPPSVRAMLPDSDALSFEAASLVCGLGVAEIALRTPWLVPLMVVPVMYLHRATMIKTLHRAALTDVKTGLLNAAAWSEHARGSLSRCARSGRGAAVLMIDVDRFKLINDSRGHLVGDQVLSQVAGVLRHELRVHDGIGRFGGDEFVVILEEVSPDAANEIARRLHASLAELDLEGAPLTTSIGLAYARTHGDDLDEILAAADAALYEAKSAGRARLRVAALPTLGAVADA